LYIGPDICLPWPSTLPTRGLSYGPIPLINHPAQSPPTNFTRASRLFYTAPQSITVDKTPISQSQKQIEVRVQSALLPRPTKDSKPIIITSSDTNMIAADLLMWEKVKRTSQIPSKQALILVDLLGGATATWPLASVMLPTGDGNNPDGCAGSFTVIHVQARVLCIDFFGLQRVCFKLTTDTIEVLTKHCQPSR
jgi:hypothetical protein